MKFDHPSSIILIGPTLSGKSSFISKLVQNIDQMFNEHIDKIIFCYNTYQNMYDKMQSNIDTNRIQFINGMIPMEQLNELGSHLKTLLIVDDLMMNVDMAQIEQLFTTGRHRNLTIVFVVHNATYKGKNSNLSTIKRNSSYIVLFKMPADVHNIRLIQSQMFPKSNNFLMAVYEKVLCGAEPYRHLVLDNRANSDHHARVYSRIFPDEDLEIFTSNDFNGNRMKIPGDNEYIDIDNNF